MNISKELIKKQVSRRGILKGMLALGVSSAFVGCSKSKGDTYGGGGVVDFDDAITPEDLSNPKLYTATCVHNCGAGVRCVSKIHVVNERIVRVGTDDDDRDFEGNYRDKEQYNDSRSLSCAKGRSYKYRAHHPGRLRYALKQTKKRGDVSGFVVIDSQVAMSEIAQKGRAIYGKYGKAAIYNTYGTSASYGGTFNNCAGARVALTTFTGGDRGAHADTDYSYHQYNYANGITGHPGVNYTYNTNAKIGSQMPAIAGVVKNIVSWGSNILSTNNTMAYPYIRAVEKMKERHADAKLYFIGPEFVDTGSTIATDWVRLRNYTDTALIMALMYHMIVNTYDESGVLKQDPLLDVNYLDTMVYGFFDSPEYWINKTTGAITTVDTAGYTKVNAVPAGRSLSAYIMGSDDRLTKVNYATADNYTAQQFSGVQTTRNAGTCTMTIGGSVAANDPAAPSSKYRFKSDFMMPKTPEWAEAITGVPAETIVELAELYADPANHPILNEWCGGLQKQENGVVNIFALSALLCVTKTFGMNGEGLFGPWESKIENPGDIGSSSDYLSSSGAKGATPAGNSDSLTVAKISNTEWSNSVKVSFKEQLDERGYTGKHIPNWDKVSNPRYAYDEGGTKAGVKLMYKADKSLDTYIGDDGLEYYDYEGRAANTPVFTGTRMIISSGGGIQMNQHPNTNDTAELLSCLKLSGSPDDADFEDNFCLVQFDPFLSPTARYADYVFPTTMALEAGDWADGSRPVGGQVVYRPPVVKAPGQAKDGWRYAYEAYKAQSDLGAVNGVNTTDAHLKYVRTATTTMEYQSAEVLSLEKVDAARQNSSSRFYKMTRDEVFANQYRARKNQPELIVTDERTGAMGGALRTALDTYLDAANDANRSTTPFVIPGNKNLSATPRVQKDGSDHHADSTGEPQFSGRFHVFNDRVIYNYERKFSKYHGWLSAEKRGQINADYEGDPIVYPIPVYIHFEDCFNEMYGVFDGKPENDLSKKGGLTMSTTHDRYRVHSTHNENPLMRELNHRVRGGGAGDDWKEYAVVGEDGLAGSTMISSAVQKKSANASWHEIWINTEDAGERGIVDGMLVRVTNPIGAVRVIARVSNRCIRGHVNLHQGGWYDPNPIDGIDDGGCANTLMSSKPSRYDNGNAQQMAYVVIEPEKNF